MQAQMVTDCHYNSNLYNTVYNCSTSEKLDIFIGLINKEMLLWHASDEEAWNAENVISCKKSSYQVIRKRCQIYFFNVKLVCKNILFNNGRELFVGLCSLRFTSVLLDHSQHSFGFGFRIWNPPNINCICWVSEKGEVWYVSCAWLEKGFK